MTTPCPPLLPSVPLLGMPELERYLAELGEMLKRQQDPEQMQVILNLLGITGGVMPKKLVGFAEGTHSFVVPLGVKEILVWMVEPGAARGASPADEWNISFDVALGTVSMGRGPTGPAGGESGREMIGMIPTSPGETLTVVVSSTHDTASVVSLGATELIKTSMDTSLTFARFWQLALGKQQGVFGERGNLGVIYGGGVGSDARGFGGAGGLPILRFPVDSLVCGSGGATNNTNGAAINPGKGFTLFGYNPPEA